MRENILYDWPKSQDQKQKFNFNLKIVLTS